MRLFAGLLAIALCTNGCTRECGPETRYTRVITGVYDPDQVRVGEVHFVMMEERGESIDRRYLSAQLNGPGNQSASSLRGHVDTARLVSTSGDVLLRVLVRDNNPDYALYVINVTESSITATRFEKIRSALVAGQLVMELTTDLPEMEVVRIPLPKADQSDFVRGPCLNYPG